MTKINNEEQRARFEILLENMDPEDLKVTANWGGEMYRDGIIVGFIAGAIGSLIGSVLYIKVKGAKERGHN